MFELLKDFTSVKLPLFLIWFGDDVFFVSALKKKNHDEYYVHANNKYFTVKCKHAHRMYYSKGLICRNRMIFPVQYSEASAAVAVQNTADKIVTKSRKFFKKINFHLIDDVQNTLELMNVKEQKSNPAVFVEVVPRLKDTHDTYKSLTPKLVTPTSWKILLFVVIGAVALIGVFMFIGNPAPAIDIDGNPIAPPNPFADLISIPRFN